MNKRLFITLVATLLILTTGSAVLAQGPSDHLVVNGQYGLQSGQSYEGDLTVVARDVDLANGSKVSGELSIVSYNAVLDGEIDGNVSILSPDVRFGDHLVINGDLSVCARNITQSNTAQITGKQSTGCNQLGKILSGIGVPRGSGPINVPLISQRSENPITQFFNVVVTACAVAALAALLAVLFPSPLNRMTNTAMSSPVTTGIAGFLSMGVAFASTAVYLFSILLTLGLMCLLLPVVGLIWLFIVIALLVGWIAVSVPLGTILLHRMKIYPTPMIAAAVGALALTFVQGFLSMLPCIGWLGGLMVIVLGSVGLGTVVLTRFGRRPYPEYVSARVRPDII